jgi:hypothetical protein
LDARIGALIGLENRDVLRGVGVRLPQHPHDALARP